MRFVFAIVALVIAAVMIGAGIAQRTIFLPPTEVVAAVSVKSTAPVTIIDGSALVANKGSQHVTLGGATTAFAAYGRTDDVRGWVGEASYNAVTYDKKTKQLTTKLVSGTEKTVPDPAGSDLWLAEYSDVLEKSPYMGIRDASFSLILVSDGTQPSPSDIRISWPLDGSTPWATPLLIGGGVVLIIGLILLLWAITRVRRARGPRRRSQKMPRLPKQPRYRPSKQRKQLPSSTRGRRSTRTSFVAVPALLAGALILTGCATPASTSAPVLAAAKSAKAAVDTSPPPAVTERQAARIIDRVAAVAVDADKALDKKALAERFAGPALALRTANYTIRKADSTEKAVAAVQTHVRLVLPQQNAGWPRTVFAVVDNEDDPSIAPIALMLIQDDARSQYKVHYAMNLEPSIVVPDVAAPADGSPRLDPETPLVALPPAEVAVAYGDILTKDTASSSYGLFDGTTDELRAAVGVTAQKAAQKKLPKTAKLTFSNAAGTEDPIVFATLDQGVIVATELDETQTVKPVEAGAAVNAPKSIKALSGKAVSSSGITAVYGDQLLFYVPQNTDDGSLIQLLGYSQGLISASEVKK